MSRFLWALLAIAAVAFCFWIEPCDDSSGHSCKHHVEATK